MASESEASVSRFGEFVAIASLVVDRENRGSESGVGEKGALVSVDARACCTETCKTKSSGPGATGSNAAGLKCVGSVAPIAKAQGSKDKAAKGARA